MRRPPILIGGGGEKVLLRIAARHADIWNNLAVFQAQLARKVEVLRRRCDELGRDLARSSVSQQCMVVIAERRGRAPREALAKASARSTAATWARRSRSTASGARPSA